MAKGLLRVSGSLDVTQFWPTGGSDADTINVSVKPDSFEFSPDPATRPFRVTHVFENASVHGKQKKPPIHNGKVTIRLQGIDATELHFAAMLPGKGLMNNGTRFRQFFGETATVQLGQFLRKIGAGTIPCRVESAVDHPNEVFDTYGRFIGDVLVRSGNHDV